MNLGIDLIDEQHRKLLDLINNIMFSIEKNNQIDDFEEIIEKTIAYTKYHFATEENLLREYGLEIKEIENHRKEHQEFLNKATKIYTDLQNDKSIKYDYGIEILTNLYNYLTTWLVHHIITKDKKIFKIAMGK